MLDKPEAIDTSDPGYEPTTPAILVVDPVMVSDSYSVWEYVRMFVFFSAWGALVFLVYKTIFQDNP